MLNLHWLTVDGSLRRLIRRAERAAAIPPQVRSRPSAPPLETRLIYCFSNLLVHVRQLGGLSKVDQISNLRRSTSRRVCHCQRSCGVRPSKPSWHRPAFSVEVVRGNAKILPMRGWHCYQACFYIQACGSQTGIKLFSLIPQGSSEYAAALAAWSAYTFFVSPGLCDGTGLRDPGERVGHGPQLHSAEHRL